MTDIEPAAISAEFSPPEETQNHVKTYGEPISFETVVKNLALLTRESQGFAYRYLSLAKQGLTNVSTLSQFPYIYSLNLSGNKLRDISPLASIISLLYLDVSDNAIEQVPKGFENLTQLQRADISRNKINQFDWTAAKSLIDLKLEENMMTDITLTDFPELLSLEVRNNLLTKVEIIAPKLCNLYMSMNQLAAFPDISGSPNIQRLYARGNEITSFAQFPSTQLTQLQHLNVRENKIESGEGMHQLSQLMDLQAIVLTGNPVCETEAYRIEILARIPQLNVIDNALVSDDERDEGKLLTVERLKQDIKVSDDKNLDGDLEVKPETQQNEAETEQAEVEE